MKIKSVIWLLALAIGVAPAAARVVGKVHALGHAAVKIEAGATIIYIDPYRLTGTPADADFILITHNHSDHLSPADINRVRKATTTFVASAPCVPVLQQNYPAATILTSTPGWKTTLAGIEIEAVPMYNVVRTNHPRASNFTGFVVNVGGVRVYHAGDTERFPEMKTFTCDVAMVPLGQTFTMTSVQEAVDAVIDLKARTAIPIHWGVAEGTLADANQFAALLSGRVPVVIATGDGFPLEAPDSVTFADHPASQTVAPGGSATFRVQASGSGTLAYQWRRNGQNLAGATNATLAVSAAAANAGDYTVVVTDTLGPVTSRMARLVVDTPRPGRLVNLSVRAPSRGVTAPLIVGCAVADGSKVMLVRGIGPALAAFGVTGALVDPRLEIHADAGGRDTIVASNNDWATGGIAAMRAAFAASGAFDLVDATSRDAALLAPIEGARTLHIFDPADRSGIALVEIYDPTPDSLPRLVNLSARNVTGSGDSTLIAGFAISGNVPKRLLIRGVGPRLAGFGVTDVLTDPKVDLFLSEPAGSVLFATNDNWAEAGAAPARAAFASVAAFDLPDATSKDAALVVTVPAGTFTAQVSGVAGAAGEAMVEIYELPER